MWMKTTLLSLSLLGAATGTAAACDCAEKQGAECTCEECKCDANEKAKGCKCKAHKKGDATHDDKAEHCHGDDNHGGEHEKAPQPK